MPDREPLVDGHGRAIGDVRVSVTDRCNFRCQYCMPAEGLPWLDRAGVMTYEEIARLVKVLAEMGVKDVRLTGGEPLARKDLHVLVGMLSADPNVDDLSLTTNGYLLRRHLPKLVEAGLERLNVSVDALEKDRFFELTRRDALDEVLAGLEAAEAYPQLRPIKVNAVALRDFTEAEAGRFVELARRKPYEIRFIEWMPLDADDDWGPDRVLPSHELREIIHAIEPLEPLGRKAHGTSDRWQFADGNGTIGFISPVSDPFCGDCNRIRLTADGKLRTCLFSVNETDLLTPMRAGVTDDELDQIVRNAVWRKELKHRINEPGFVKPGRSMSQIGG